MGTMSVLEEVRLERKRQDGKWGDQRSLDDGTWLRIFMEELGEAMKHRNEREHEKMRQELVESAAVLVAWVESFDHFGPDEWGTEREPRIRT